MVRTRPRIKKSSKKKQTKLNKTNSDFSDSCDDDMIAQMNSKQSNESKTSMESTETDDEIEVNLKSRQKKDEVLEQEEITQKVSPFISEVLPKLPKLRNGMRLLCVHEQSPLINTGELYKARIFRPDRPLASSEIFEDGSRVRFTNLSRMINDDFVIARFKFELVSFKTGLADSDMVGLKTVDGIFEAEDIGNLTLKPFIERKIKGKTSLKQTQPSQYIVLDLLNVVLEITVLKKAWECEITTMKDGCAIQYGSECNANAYCMLCLVKDDMRELTRIFESNEEKTEFGKTSTKLNLTK